MDEHSKQTERWSIYAAENLLFGNFYHSFLMLVDETNGETLKELHFSAYAANGKKKVLSGRPLNLMAAVADRFNLLAAFKRAADKTHIGRYLVRIKGVQTNGRHRLQDVDKSRLCFSGPPAQVMGLWNTLCREAIALNKTDMPFLPHGLGRPALNCRAGTEMVLEGLGLTFNALMVKGNSRTGIGRHLLREIKGLDKVRRDSPYSRLSDLLQENEELQQDIFLTRPQARHRAGLKDLMNT